MTKSIQNINFNIFWVTYLILDKMSWQSVHFDLLQMNAKYDYIVDQFKAKFNLKSKKMKQNQKSTVIVFRTVFHWLPTWDRKAISRQNGYTKHSPGLQPIHEMVISFENQLEQSILKLEQYVDYRWDMTRQLYQKESVYRNEQSSNGIKLGVISRPIVKHSTFVHKYHFWNDSMTTARWHRNQTF